jgi:ribosomal protein S18 acetylase RimI-like enzyme
MLLVEFIVVRLSSLEGIPALADAARSEGFQFLDRLIREWEDGTNRFVGAGEALFGAFLDGELVGTAGLTHQREAVGRLRRVYILPRCRRHGIGEALTRKVLEFARLHCREVVLLTENPAAALLYERLGFISEAADGPDRASHRLILR